MAPSSRSSQCTIHDLPDDVLERVFALAGQRLYPAIVGVSKRWWRVCWGSRQLWQHLDMRCNVPEDPIAAAAAANPPLSFGSEEWKQRRQRRDAGYTAAKRTQLEQVGRWAQAVHYDRSMAQVVPLPAMLRMLSPEALVEVALYIPELQTEEAELLAGFNRLTCLEFPVPQGFSVGPMLRQLPRLELLFLKGYQMDEQLIAAVQDLTGLTHLDLGAAFLPSLRGLSGLQLLRHLEFNTWARGTPTDEAILLPTPARFAALQSYTYLNEYAHEVLQLDGVRFKQMFFAPMPRTPAGVDGDPSAQGQHADAQPGSLYVEGLQLQTLDAGGGAPLNSFLEAALPPRSTLLGLELYCCSLGAPPLQRLPAIARLESLDVGKCQCTGSMAATLRALVQAAPALTGLRFNVGGAPADDHSANRLRRWPAYLLAHPSLRCLTLLDCGEFEQAAEQPLLPPPSTAAAEPVLQSLLTDGFASVPPQLAAVTGLRNLGFTNVRFNMTAAGLDTLLALPHLTYLALPRLSAAGQQVAEQLRSARPELAVRQPRR